MSEQPITWSVLMRFHREVFLPDLERIVGDGVGGAERHLRDEMRVLHDSLLVRFERLEIVDIKAGLDRVEQRLDSLETDVRDLTAQMRRLDERLSRVEKRLDELAASPQRDTLQAQVQDLKARLDVVETQVAALQKPEP
jgi:predicted  nucleic acid-binding Zn-ribbon protein